MGLGRRTLKENGRCWNHGLDSIAFPEVGGPATVSQQAQRHSEDLNLTHLSLMARGDFVTDPDWLASSDLIPFPFCLWRPYPNLSDNWGYASLPSSEIQVFLFHVGPSLLWN